MCVYCRHCYTYLLTFVQNFPDLPFVVRGRRGEGGPPTEKKKVPLLVYKMILGCTWGLEMNYNESHNEKVTSFPRFFPLSTSKNRSNFDANTFLRSFMKLANLISLVNRGAYGSRLKLLSGNRI